MSKKIAIFVVYCLGLSISSARYLNSEATYYHPSDSEDDVYSSGFYLAVPTSRISEYGRWKRDTVSAGPFGFSLSDQGGGPGWRPGPAWFHLAQEFNRRGVSAPMVVNGGMYLNNAQRRVLTEIGASHQMHGGYSASAKGSGTVFSHGDHSVSVSAGHTQPFDKNLNRLPATNTAGVQYQNANGASVSLSGSHTPGSPDTGSVSGSVPVYTSNNGAVQVTATGTTNFGHGQKPNHEVGLNVEVRP